MRLSHTGSGLDLAVHRRCSRLQLFGTPDPCPLIIFDTKGIPGNRRERIEAVACDANHGLKDGMVLNTQAAD
jgi:hypothetical protein